MILFLRQVRPQWPTLVNALLLQVFHLVCLWLQDHFYNALWINLTEVFLNKRLKTFVQIGSSSEYGNLSSPQKESNKCKPKLTYGKSKLLATKHLISLNKEKSFPSVVLRLYQAFGPAQDLNRFMPIIISGCLKDKKFPCSEGTQFRDFIYVEDVVDAIFKSLKNRKALGEIINIGTRYSLSCSLEAVLLI